MIAALLASTKVCEGPRVCRREYGAAWVSGAADGDVVQIGEQRIVGDGALDISGEGEFIRVLHVTASGFPVTVELR